LKPMEHFRGASADTPKTKQAEPSWPRPVRRAVIASVALVLAAASIGLAVTALRQPPRSGGLVEPTTSPSYLALDERWAPPTYREGDHVVMPVTFPDGTTAELVYPPQLGLGELSVYPDAFADRGPRECGWSVSGTRYDPHAGWIGGDAPLAEHVREDGGIVALWEGTRDNEPYDFLVYRFGSWSVLVPCRERIDEATLAIWAENLHGHEASDGLLVLEGTPPLVLHPWRDQNGPTLRLSDEDVIVDLRPLSEQCDPASGWGGDTDPGDGVVQWCAQPEGGIYVYANGFTGEGKDFLEALVDGLEVRHVHAAT
jgi:hypothetical protein